MLQAHYDTLKSKLEGVMLDVDGQQKSAIELVSYWEEGVRKTRDANKDLTTQRDQWESERKTLKTQLDQLTAAKTDLEKKIEEASGTGKKKTAENEELTRQLNALADQIKTLDQKYKEAEEQRQVAAVAAKESSKAAATEKLKADIVNELGKHKIVGSQAEAAFATMTFKGMTRIVEDAEKGFVPVFVTLKDGKELSASLSSMCKTFADENPFFVSASGNKGSGEPHKSGDGGGNRPSAADMLRMRR